VVGVAIALVIHYVPYWNDAKAARSDAQQLVARVRAVGLNVTRGQLDDLQSQLDDLDAGLAPFRSLLSDDPLVGIARGLPLLKDQVQGGSAIVGAADDLINAGRIALGLGDRFVAMRDAALRPRARG